MVKEELCKILAHDELAKASLLVLANKQVRLSPRSTLDGLSSRPGSIRWMFGVCVAVFFTAARRQFERLVAGSAVIQAVLSEIYLCVVRCIFAVLFFNPLLYDCFPPLAYVIRSSVQVFAAVS